MAHFKAVYFQHSCSDPAHLEVDYPDGTRNTPIAVNQLVVADPSPRKEKLLGCVEHGQKHLEGMEVHYLNQAGSVFHRVIPRKCVRIIDEHDLTQEDALTYLQSSPIRGTNEKTCMLVLRCTDEKPSPDSTVIKCTYCNQDCWISQVSLMTVKSRGIGIICCLLCSANLK